MKKILTIILSICLSVTLLSIVVYADSSTHVYYDSVKLSQMELDGLNEYSKKLYDGILATTNETDIDKISEECGYDITLLLNGNPDVLKCYYDDFFFANITDIVEYTDGIERFSYIKPVSETEALITKNTANVNEDERYDFAKLDSTDTVRFGKLLKNGKQVFADTNITKEYKDLVVYASYWIKATELSLPQHIIYYVTNYGEYVFYSPRGEEGNEYLVPAGLYNDLIEELVVITGYYFDDSQYGGYQAHSRFEVLIDASDYLVGGEAKEDLQYVKSFDYSEYPIGIAMGYKNTKDFNAALVRGGYTDYKDFIEKMDAAGYVNYSQYRNALDEQIAENAVKNAEANTERETNPNDENAGNGKYLYLLWIIIPVAVIIIGFVVFIAVGRKKRAV